MNLSSLLQGSPSVGRALRWRFALPLALSLLSSPDSAWAQGESGQAPESGAPPAVEAQSLPSEPLAGDLLRLPEGTPGGPVFRVPVTGTIEMGLAPFIERSIEEAVASGARAVILDIDTPGGRVDSAERIADAVSDAPVPVYAFVNRRAFSAGAMISLAAHEIYMRPGAVMGAVTPVDGTGERAPEKVVSAMRSSMRALAEARGLDPAVAEAMVDEEIEIPGLTEAGKLLTLTTEEAVQLGYASQVEDWDALMVAIGSQGGEVVDQEVNWAERLVRFFTNPIVAPFLLSIGFLGLLVEIRTPGVGAAGLVGVLALGLFFGSHFIVGLAGLEGILIFLLGAVLLAVEAFFIPGMGVLGLIGALAVVAGVYMSMLGGIPTMGDFTRSGTVLTISLLMAIAGGILILRRMPSNRKLTTLGIFLGESTSKEGGFVSADRREDLVGKEGVAMTDLRPAGTGLFGEERLDVVSDSEWIEHGTPIRIIASEGYRHVVRAAKSS
jgi:membrane-bound serine protease (ClpP class)